MLPIFIGGLISGIGSAVGGFLGYKGQKDTNRTNMQLGQDQMDFQERMVNQAQDFEKEMSSSAYQRAMTDMKKAGLNPMLAYQQGGASTPIGKTAPGAMPQMANPAMSASTVAQGVGQAATSASTIMSQAQERENMQSKLLNDEAYRQLNSAQQEQIKETIRKIQAEIDNIGAQTTGRMSDNAIKQIIEDHFKTNNSLALFDRLGTGPAALGIIGGYFGLQNLKNAPRGSSYPESRDSGGNWRPPGHFRDQIGIGR